MAIVGRPNVGKSTLFNRLIGERLAIVEDMRAPRDRVYGTGDWNGRDFTLVDTGGLELEAGTHIEARVQDQARVAMEEADVILFVVDAAAGLAPLDHEVADRLRRASSPPSWSSTRRQPAAGAGGRRVLRAGHGSRHHRQRPARSQHRRPGRHDRGRPAAGSAEPPEPDWTDESLSPDELTELAETEIRRVAIVGRPNTGKSTFVNRVLGQERMIVSDAPGTTRDPVDTAVVVDDSPLVLVDTAGIRRRGSVQQGIERYSVLRSMKAIDRADVAVVMTDATEGYGAGRARGRARAGGRQGHRAGHQQVDVVEKDGHTADAWLKVLRREAPYLAWADIVFASAQTGQRMERVLREARRVAGHRRADRPRTGRDRCGPRPSAVTSATAWARFCTPPRSRSRRPRS